MQIEIRIYNPDTGLDWTLPHSSDLSALELKQAFKEMFETVPTDGVQEK